MGKIEVQCNLEETFIFPTEKAITKIKPFYEE